MKKKPTIIFPLPQLARKKIGIVSVNVADNNHDNDLHRHMEAQEQTSKAQQATLDNIQQMLADPKQLEQWWNHQ